MSRISTPRSMLTMRPFTAAMAAFTSPTVAPAANATSNCVRAMRIPDASVEMADGATRSPPMNVVGASSAGDDGAPVSVVLPPRRKSSGRERQQLARTKGAIAQRAGGHRRHERRVRARRLRTRERVGQ